MEGNKRERSVSFSFLGGETTNEQTTEELVWVAGLGFFLGGAF